MSSHSLANLLEVKSVWLVGIDLAWGEKNRDGLCLIHATRQSAEVHAFGHTHGDAEMLAWLAQHISAQEPALILVDAPLVIANATGTRPVDRLTHQLFRQQHAACHPANLGKCPRPVRIGVALNQVGYTLGWDLTTSPRLAAEVYPHPAMVRLFDLPRIIKYKKGTVVERRAEFKRLQQLLKLCLKSKFPHLKLDQETKRLLQADWTKPLEDRTDAFFCALIGYHHWLHRGEKSEAIGDLATGFILLPK